MLRYDHNLSLFFMVRLDQRCSFHLEKVDHDKLHDTIQFRKNSDRRRFVKKVANFAKFTGKHLYQGLFLNRFASHACNFIKKEALVQVFLCGFCEVFKNTFFTKHLRTTASAFKIKEKWEYNYLISSAVLLVPTTARKIFKANIL